MSADMHAADSKGLDLQRCRQRIDDIDAQIVSLFQERMKVAADVAAYKQSSGMAVFDPVRERQVIERAQSRAMPDFKAYVPALFNQLMESSRTYQHELLKDGSKRVLGYMDVSTNASLPGAVSVSCQGVEGAYSHIASQRLFDHPFVRFRGSWAEVCADVERGSANFGVLPLENSTAGTVDAVYDLLYSRRLYIVQGVSMRINHDLLALPGTRIEDVREVVSHEQALRQCDSFIHGLSPDVKTTAVANTALAAQMVAQSGRTDCAAISSADCAELYGLSVLRKRIQDQTNNFTRFVCVSRKAICYKGADRTSFIMTLAHECGSLSRVLSLLATMGINVLKLESKPIPGSEFQFMFYMDVACAPGRPMFDAMMEQLPQLCDMCVYLGSYREIAC